MGAGGNLIANLLSLDINFNFYGDDKYSRDYQDQQSRYNFLKNYYLRPVTAETWLRREWDIRAKHGNRFYLNNTIRYWDPQVQTVYILHGSADEINSILLDQTLQNWDRAGIENGRVTEQVSPWTLQECTHIFILPKDIDHITDIYASKNYSLNQFNQNESREYRQHQAYRHNRSMYERLLETQEFLIRKNRQVLTYSAEDLFQESGIDLINDIVSNVGASIELEYLKEIHSIWLQSSRDLYYNMFNQPL
jgi:hypothetical protein